VRAYVDIGVVVAVLAIANVMAHFTTAWANIATVPVVAIGLVLLVRARGLSWTELGLGREHWKSGTRYAGRRRTGRDRDRGGCPAALDTADVPQ